MAAGALVIVAGLVGLVAERAARPIAANALTDWLRQHGAPSRIDLRRFDLDGLSARLTLGDPRDPDLTVERLDVTYALSGPWNGKALAITPRTVRLVRPRLRIRLADGRLDFGRLGGLVAWAKGLPPSSQALPDIEMVDGAFRIQTPTGAVILTGSGKLGAGRLEQLRGRIAPVAGLSIGGIDLNTRGGGFRLEGRGGQLLADLDLGPSQVSSGGRTAAAATFGDLRLSGAMPYPDRPGRVGGTLRLGLSVRDLRAETPRARGAISTLEASLDGGLDAAADHQAFTGALTGAVSGLSGSLGDETLTGALGRLALTHLVLVHTAEGVSSEANGQLSARAARVESPSGVLTGLTADLSLAGGRLAGKTGRVDVSARLSGAIHGHGAAAPARVRALIAAIPLLAGERPYARALAAALAGFDVSAPDIRLDLHGNGGRLALNAPLTLIAGSGARLTVVGAAAADAARITGAAGLRLDGGGAPSLDLAIDNAVATGDGARGHFTGRLGVETAALRGGVLTANGDLAMAGGALRLNLDACAPIEAARLDLPTEAVRDFAVRLCPGPAPLLVLSNSRWRSAGRLEGGAVSLPDVNLAVRRTDLDFEADGAPTKPFSARLRLAGLDVSDAAATQRFRPLAVAGRLDLERGFWRGTFQARLAAGRALANITLVDDVERSKGRLDVSAPDLAFATGGLQPADLSPLLAPIRSVEARLALSGWFVWDGEKAPTSGGELTARADRLTGPTGVMRNVATDIRLTSLFPLASGPGQTLSVGVIEAVTPLTDLQGRFQLEADAVSVERFDAGFAKGRVSLEPFRAAFAPDATFSSALVLRDVDLGEIIAATSVADSVQVMARVNGRVPFTASPAGLAVRQGTLAADGPGRISIARKAFKQAVAGGAQENYAQDFAFQAMEDLAFDTLDATVVGLPDDRLGMIFHVKGRHDPAVRQRAIVRLTDLARGQVFSRPLPLPSGTAIDMTLDTSLNFGELLAAIGASWREALAARGASGANHAAEKADPAASTGPETRRQ
jgi:hypothetical protein